MYIYVYIIFYSVIEIKNTNNIICHWALGNADDIIGGHNRIYIEVYMCVCADS